MDCLYGTNYHRDIDLYCHHDSNRMGMSEFLRTSGIFLRSSRSNRSYDSPGGISNHLFEGGSQPTTIQYIELNLKPRKNERRPLKDIINATYDLDICKSCFDGEKLYVRSWTKLFGRYDYIKCNMRFVMRFYNDEQDGTDLHQTELRAEKYRSRGFDIKTHPLNDLIIEHIKSVMKTSNAAGIEAVDDGLINLDKFYME